MPNESDRDRTPAVPARPAPGAAPPGDVEAGGEPLPAAEGPVSGALPEDACPMAEFLEEFLAWCGGDRWKLAE